MFEGTDRFQMSKLPYYKMYPADFDNDANVRAMDDRDKGFYIGCLHHSWHNDMTIPADLAQLAEEMHRTEAYVRSRWVKVGKCWAPVPGRPDRLMNPRLSREYGLALESWEKRSRAGSKGGRPKKQPESIGLSEEKQPESIGCTHAYGSVSVSEFSSPEDPEYSGNGKSLALTKISPPDFAKRVSAMVDAWKYPSSNLQVVQQTAASIVAEGADFDVVESGIYELVAWNHSRGWKNRDRLVDVLTMGAWQPNRLPSHAPKIPTTSNDSQNVVRNMKRS